MPLHFNSFIADEDENLKTTLFSSMMTKYTENSDDIFATDDKKYIHLTSFIKDIKEEEKIGKVVITIANRGNALEVIDSDMTLLTNNKTKLHFEEMI